MKDIFLQIIEKNLKPQPTVVMAFSTGRPIPAGWEIPEF